MNLKLVSQNAIVPSRKKIKLEKTESTNAVLPVLKKIKLESTRNNTEACNKKVIKNDVAGEFVSVGLLRHVKESMG